MITLTDKKSLPDIRGRNVKINRCLVAGMATPGGGWRVSFVVKKTKVYVTGATPTEVYGKSRKLLSDNGVEITESNLWFSLNYQWMDRVKDSDMVVPKSIIENAAKGSEEMQDPHKYHHPSEWGSIEWNAMANYLNVDEPSYSYNEFMSRVETTLKLLNPVHASRIGCADCYREFSKFVSQLRTTPLHNLDDARHWLVDTHNAVNQKLNKPVLEYKVAKRVNRWN